MMAYLRSALPSATARISVRLRPLNRPAILYLHQRFKSEGEGVDVVATPAENKLELTTRVTPTTLPYLETTADRAIQICIRF